MEINKNNIGLNIVRALESRNENYKSVTMIYENNVSPNNNLSPENIKSGKLKKISRRYTNSRKTPTDKVIDDGIILETILL